MTSEERMELWQKIAEANKGKEFFLVHCLRDFYTEEGRRKYLAPSDGFSVGPSKPERRGSTPLRGTGYIAND
jgi:hypothetical protein